jgi:hypothetical protein
MYGMEDIMFKKLVFLIIGFGLLLSTGYAGDTCTLCGEVIFQYEGDIYVCLYTVDDWVDFQTRDTSCHHKSATLQNGMAR